MSYINKVDREFVQKFAKNFFKKYYKAEKVSVVAGLNCYNIIAYVDKNVATPQNVVVLLYDYHAYSESTYAWAFANKDWQVALYKKFGDKYLQDLKENLSAQVLKETRKKLNEIDTKIEKIKNGYYEDKTK